jgi:hypothetical protein
MPEFEFGLEKVRLQPGHCLGIELVLAQCLCGWSRQRDSVMQRHSTRECRFVQISANHF